MCQLDIGKTVQINPIEEFFTKRYCIFLKFFSSRQTNIWLFFFFYKIACIFSNIFLFVLINNTKKYQHFYHKYIYLLWPIMGVFRNQVCIFVYYTHFRFAELRNGNTVTVEDNVIRILKLFEGDITVFACQETESYSVARVGALGVGPPSPAGWKMHLKKWDYWQNKK